MEISFIKFDQAKHYETICSWWKAHKWDAIPLDALSDDGIVITSDGQPVCACWLYRTNSSICWVEWYVANPTAPRKIRNICIDKMIEISTSLAQMLGFKSVFSSVKVGRFIKRLEENDFIKSDQEMTNLIRIL